MTSNDTEQTVNVTDKLLYVSGMTCGVCELRINKALKELEGVTQIKVNLSNGTVNVTYNSNVVSHETISQTINDLGYDIIDKSVNSKVSIKLIQIAIIGIIILGSYMVLDRLRILDIFNYVPRIAESMSFAAVFVIGLLTSVHCIGMCGGINLSQCIDVKGRTAKERIRPSFLYNFGRLISYTAIGGIVGALGSIISFSGLMRGVVALFAGVFMIIMGLNMLNLFPWIRLTKHLPKFITGCIQEKRKPLLVGILNGFMPCGSLQAMQLYALSTGSFIQGAISMFLFALGTSPLMFGFGAVSSLLSKKSTSKMMMASAVLVVILGASMFNMGLSMSGFIGIGTEKSDLRNFQPLIVDGYQIVEIDVLPDAYAPIVVKKDIPVKFNLRAKESNINGCNNAIIIPDFEIHMPITPGDNIVEFTPIEVGIIPYSCWMNMINSSITVIE